MCRIEPPDNMGIQKGRTGELVFYSYHGKSYARLYVKPVNPNTPKQKIVRKTLGDAVRSWQKLAAEEKIKYSRMGKRFYRSGYHHYISLYTTNNISDSEVKEDKQGISAVAGNAIHSSMVLGHYVPTPSLSDFRLNSCNRRLFIAPA